MAGYEHRDHISDVRVKAWGSCLEETFAQACLGMWALVAEPSSVPLKTRWTVLADGQDLDELLVNLLNEQILAFDAKGLVAAGVESLSVEERGGIFTAKAALSGCESGQLRNPPAGYLKAATFHDLLVSATLVEVTLDI